MPAPLASARRKPLAAVNWSSGLSPLKICPTSNSATSASPRSALRCADMISPGSRLGRMSDNSAAIGLASARAALPPPNSSASRLDTNDQVTASVMPRAASARLALRVRFWIGVSTALRASGPRGNGVDGTWSTPTMRTSSSTMSARPCTSGRHDGTATLTRSFWPAAKKPSFSSTRRTSVSGSLSPASRGNSLSGKSMTLSFGVGSPATTISDASPPQKSSTNCVASSSPGSMKFGSTPRSKR